MTRRDYSEQTGKVKRYGPAPGPRHKPGFLSERRAALLSMDRDKVLAYMRRWQASAEELGIIAVLESDDDLFWKSLHFARAACPELPKADRDSSRRWLKHHDLKVPEVK